MVLLQDSMCPEKLARSSPDLKCPKNEVSGDKGGEEEVQDITATLLVPAPTHGDSRALHRSAPVEPGDHQATHWVTS